MAYPGVFMLDDATIFRAMLQAAKHGGMICMHAENGGAIDVLVQRALAEGKTAPKYHALTRPTTAEGEATSRAIALAEMAGAPVYIVHLSCNDALEKVREARDRGLPAYAETCPQYLHLSLENMDVPGFEGAKFVFILRSAKNGIRKSSGKDWRATRCKSSPPTIVRFASRNKRRWAETTFTKIQMASRRRTSSQPDYSGGVHGGKFSANRFVQLISTAPAKLFGLYPRKGTIAVGSDADLVIFDPNAEQGDQRADASHARGLLHVRGNSREGRDQNCSFARRVIIDGGKFTGRRAPVNSFGGRLFGRWVDHFTRK